MYQVTVNAILENASTEQLAQVKGIGTALAERILTNAPYDDKADMLSSVEGLGEKNSAELLRLLAKKIEIERRRKKAKAGVGSTRCYAVYARNDEGTWLVEARAAWKQSDVEDVHTSMRQALLDWMEAKPNVDFTLKPIGLGLFKRWKQEDKSLLQVS